MEYDSSYKEYLFSDEILNLDPEERQEVVLSLLNSDQEQTQILQSRENLRFKPPNEWQGQSTYDALNVAVKCAKSKIVSGEKHLDTCTKCNNHNSCTECPVVAFKISPQPLSLSDYYAITCNDKDRDACMAICQHCSSLYLLTMRAINSLKVSAK